MLGRHDDDNERHRDRTLRWLDRGEGEGRVWGRRMQERWREAVQGGEIARAEMAREGERERREGEGEGCRRGVQERDAGEGEALCGGAP